MDLKHIYLLHHSHFDVGFTHSQVVLEQLQTDFLDQVLDVLDATEDWDENSKPRWTIEVHQQLTLWLESAAPEKIDRLKQYVQKDRIGLGAIQYNTSPLSSLESLCKQLSAVRAYRTRFGFPVKVGFQHDVNGLPWVMTDLMLDAGVELFVMGVNLHTGGNGPVRPGLFKWRTPSGRTLKTFSGYHYSAFDVITKPLENNIKEMKAGLDEQWSMLQDMGYPYDFLYLSTTNVPVAYDNGGPSLMTAEKVREWNGQEGLPTIQYVTPEQLVEKLNAVPDQSIPEFSGDWNDFWNYGAGSAARETGINAHTKQKLFSAAMLSLQQPANERLEKLQAQAWDRVTLFDEHTWGYWAHAMHLNHPQVITTEIYKRGSAHDGHEMARYVLGSRLANYAGNPAMSKNEGLLAVNPSPVKKAVTLNMPAGWRDKLFGRLNGYSYQHSEPLTPATHNSFRGSTSGDLVHVELDPFSSVRLPWSACSPPEPVESIREGSMEEVAEVQTLDGHDMVEQRKGHRFIESEFHYLEYNPVNGRVERLLDKKTGWDVLPASADYNLFEPVHEKPDPRFDASRKSYYDRVVDVEMKFETCWKENWKAARNGVSSVLDVRVEKSVRAICLIREYSMEGASKIIQRFELSADRPWIEVDVIVHKDKVDSPESIYFVSALNLKKDWAATYDGSGIPIKLDDEQLPQTSNGWITTEAFTRMEDDGNQFSVFAPCMPLVQVGGFNWGKPKDNIPRQENPLLLNWACNNYWETNYFTSQEGAIRYNCAIYTSRDETNEQTYRMADAFARKPLFLPLAQCGEVKSEQLVLLDNPNVRLASIEKSTCHDGFVCRLVNSSDTEQTCVLDVIKEIRGASLVSPVEDVLGKCEFEGSEVKVTIPAKTIVSVLSQFNER